MTVNCEFTIMNNLSPNYTVVTGWQTHAGFLNNHAYDSAVPLDGLLLLPSLLTKTQEYSSFLQNMDNFQKFNIINPKRGTCETHYERAGLPPMWQRCLRYRPRAKDFRVLRPPVNRIRRMQRSVGRHWSHTPVDVQAKNSMSFGYVEIPTTHIPMSASIGDGSWSISKRNTDYFYKWC